MSIGLLIGLAICLIIIATALTAIVAAPRLGVVARILALCLLLPIACFCVFGFAASFEPGESHLKWRILYTVIFIVCLAGAVRLVIAKGNNSS